MWYIRIFFEYLILNIGGGGGGGEPLTLNPEPKKKLSGHVSSLPASTSGWALRALGNESRATRLRGLLKRAVPGFSV